MNWTDTVLRQERAAHLGCVIFSILTLLHGGKCNASDLSKGQRNRSRLSVEDVARMAQFGQSISRSDGADGHLASFSPDGSKFVIVLRKPDLVRNVDVFSMLLYRTSKAFQSSKCTTILRMSSRSNRGAIRNVRWLEDNRTITFLGEWGGKTAQVYAYDIGKRSLRMLTRHDTAIDDYVITANGRRVVYIAEPRESQGSAVKEPGGVVIRGLDLRSLLKGEYETQDPYTRGKDLFVSIIGHRERLITTQDVLAERSIVSFSPDQQHILLWGYRLKVPHEWAQYTDPDIRQLASDSWENGHPSPFRQYFVLDTSSGRTKDILEDSPILGYDKLCWSEDGGTLFIQKAWLSLDGDFRAERDSRRDHQFPVSVQISEGLVHEITADDWNNALEKSQRNASAVSVSVVQDLNTPPRAYLIGKDGRKTLLFKLNPQIASLDIGLARVVTWKDTQGRESQGGLYLPTNYEPGRRLALVIQTHGFLPHEFSMGGVSDWGGSFAARLLAVNGIAVLQCCTSPGFNLLSEEGEGSVRQIEGAIRHLNEQGIIDPERIGIMGFSRTVFEVGYVLTHSKARFSAATLIDGIDGGYFQYLVWGPTDNVHINHAEPVGSGLQKWLDISPGFNLDRVALPVRLEAHGNSDGLLGLWQWYAGLRYQHKPVDMMLLPQAAHIPSRPWEKRSASEQEVDWMRFWLKNEQDDDPAKSAQYERWQRLRVLKDQSRSAQADAR